MDFWKCREESLAALGTSLKPVAALLESAFERVDEATGYFQQFLLTAPDPTGRVCAVAVVKGRNLALGCYSLALDGLAQESGALLRPLVEVIELLNYLRTVPGAVEQLLEDKLPIPGERARKIGSPFHRLRKYLNSSAAHLDFGPESIRHLLDIASGRLHVVQSFDPAALEWNLATLFVVTAALGREAAACFQSYGHGVAPVSAESLVNKAAFCASAGEPLVSEILKKRRQPVML